MLVVSDSYSGVEILHGAMEILLGRGGDDAAPLGSELRFSGFLFFDNFTEVIGIHA
jgi:hypothetical protein